MIQNAELMPNFVMKTDTYLITEMYILSAVLISMCDKSTILGDVLNDNEAHSIGVNLMHARLCLLCI